MDAEKPVTDPAAAVDQRTSPFTGAASSFSGHGETVVDRAVADAGARPAGDGVLVGHAGRDAVLDRGWLLGHFHPPGHPRHSSAVEVKWGVHPAGDQRARWATGEVRTALLVLISGRFRLDFPQGSVTLAEQGAYVMWGKGVDHSWFAEEASVVLVVRWPSVPGYQIPPEPAGGR